MPEVVTDSLRALTDNSFFRILGNLALILLIPILIYFNSQLNNTSIRLTAIETKMDVRGSIRQDQISAISETLADHEGRIRALEKIK